MLHLLFLLFANVFPTARSARAPIPVAVAGRVLASLDSTPIHGASVTFVGTRFGTITDSLGYFRLTADLPKGAVRLIVRAIGFEPFTKTLSLDSALSVDLGSIVLKVAVIRVEDLIVTSPCSRYRSQPPDSLRRLVKRQGRDSLGRFWDVCAQ